MSSTVPILRRAGGFALALGVLSFASAAGAAQVYSLGGKFARSNGYYINIPLIGNNPGNVPNCGYTKNPMAGMTKLPGATPIVNGARYTIMSTGVATPPTVPQVFANPAGCVSAGGMLTATAAGTGAAFTIPTKAFSRPLPGMTLAVSIPFLPNVIQLATSFQVTGPPSMMPTAGPDVPNGTMNNGTNTAQFRYFHKSAWLSQTGRAGSMFTWCFGNPGCSQGTMGTFMGIPANGVNGNGSPSPPPAYPVHEVFVKYTPGPNKFGGTMSHIISVGPNFASLAISAGGALQLLGLAGMGSQPTGRGYADFLTDPLMGGPAWAMFMVGPVPIPEIMGTQYLVTSVMTGPIPATMATVATNKNFGFPWTTGTVLARNTGTDIQGNPVVVTLTGMGTDYLTSMGGRNIQLVAGAVAGIDLLSSETPALNQMFLKLPEPSGPAPWLAGVALLLGVAAWRSRRAPASDR